MFCAFCGDPVDGRFCSACGAMVEQGKPTALGGGQSVTAPSEASAPQAPLVRPQVEPAPVEPSGTQQGVNASQASVSGDERISAVVKAMPSPPPTAAAPNVKYGNTEASTGRQGTDQSTPGAADDEHSPDPISPDGLSYWDGLVWQPRTQAQHEHYRHVGYAMKTTDAGECLDCGRFVQPEARSMHPRYCVAPSGDRTAGQPAAAGPTAAQGDDPLNPIPHERPPGAVSTGQVNEAAVPATGPEPADQECRPTSRTMPPRRQDDKNSPRRAKVVGIGILAVMLMAGFFIATGGAASTSSAGSGPADGAFGPVARAAVSGSAMADLSDETLASEARAICSDLKGAHDAESMALTDMMKLVHVTDHVYSTTAGKFAAAATNAYCPQFSSLRTIQSFVNAGG